MWQFYLIAGLTFVVLLAVIGGGLYLAIMKVGPAQILVDLIEIGVSRLLPPIASQIAKDMTSPEVDARNKAEARWAGGRPPSGTGVTTGKTITQPALTRRERGR